MTVALLFRQMYFYFGFFCYLPPIGLDKRVNLNFYFSYFSKEAYDVGTHLNCLNETIQMSTTTNVFVEK